MSELKRKNKNVMLSLVAVVAGMVMLAYAAVPLYSIFCRMTGYGGTPKIGAISAENIIGRMVNVSFNSDVEKNLPLTFIAPPTVATQIGKRNLAFFTVQNNGDSDIVGMASYNVVPFKVGSYFVKLKCFCFEKQLVKAGEKINFPVSFYVDSALNDDKYLDDIKNITLSYTFFELKE
jgi:cytochrome c oxidase assembly protein subunit 11